jgi:hypothetical protein
MERQAFKTMRWILGLILLGLCVCKSEWFLYPWKHGGTDAFCGLQNAHPTVEIIGFGQNARNRLPALVSSDSGETKEGKKRYFHNSGSIMQQEMELCKRFLIALSFIP